MSKQAWTAHMIEQGFPVRGTRAELLPARDHMETCPVCSARRRSKAQADRRRERDEAMRDLGMVKTAYGWE